MRTTTLGRTGLTVSVAGLGCGGHSRLGLGTGHDEAHAVAMIHAALDAGVTFIDTARVYGTEPVVGRALEGHREGVVISTKLPVVQPGTPATGMDLVSARDYLTAFEQTLINLRTDYVDILHLHGVTPAQYDYCAAELVPALMILRDQGKIRFLGLTERFIVDPGHAMLDKALEDECWDVIMVGFSMINPSARQRVFPRSQAKGMGVLNMFAVRRALSDPDALAEVVDLLIGEGAIDAASLDQGDPLAFLTATGAARDLVEAAYRFCRHESGIHIVLTGTGNPDHLRQNLAAIQKPPLPDHCLEKLADIFGRVASVSGE